MWSNQTTNAIAPQWFNFSYALQLQPVNAVTYTYNGDLRATIPLTDYGTFNTVRQLTLWNYIPTAYWKTANIVEGGAQTLISNLSQVLPLNQASVTNTNWQVGSQSGTLSFPHDLQVL